MLFRLVLLLSFLATTVCGCASGTKSTTPKYETVSANPRRDPEAAKRLNKNGVDALAKGKYEKAEKLFKEALAKDVDFGPAHNNLGRLYFDQGKNYLAAWEFEYATKVMPKRGEPYNNLGMVMERVGKLEQAIEAYEMANLLCPNDPEITGNLARAWWCQDKSNLRTRELLEHLVFVDCRPNWVAWAKEQIACGKLASNEVLPVTYDSKVTNSASAPTFPPSSTVPMPVRQQGPMPQPIPVPMLAPPQIPPENLQRVYPTGIPQPAPSPSPLS